MRANLSALTPHPAQPSQDGIAQAGCSPETAIAAFNLYMPLPNYLSRSFVFFRRVFFIPITTNIDSRWSILPSSSIPQLNPPLSVEHPSYLTCRQHGRPGSRPQHSRGPCPSQGHRYEPLRADRLHLVRSGKEWCGGQPSHGHRQAI